MKTEFGYAFLVWICSILFGTLLWMLLYGSEMMDEDFLNTYFFVLLFAFLYSVPAAVIFYIAVRCIAIFNPQPFVVLLLRIIVAVASCMITLWIILDSFNALGIFLSYAIAQICTIFIFHFILRQKYYGVVLANKNDPEIPDQEPLENNNSPSRA